MPHFLLIDDHVIVRASIRQLLFDYFKPCEVDEAESGKIALQKLHNSSYDLILMDIQMPDTDTFSLMEFISAKYPKALVLILSMTPENIYAKRFLKADAKGFISKTAPMEEIKKAIARVLNGRIYTGEALAETLVQDKFSKKTVNIFDKLSRREFEIMSLLLAGQKVSDISRSLKLQMSTIGTHKARLFEKLQVTNLLQLKELATAYNL